MTRVLVIGGGMAGTVAALAARRKGASVTLACRAYGATAVSSGAIDVAADPLATPEDPRGSEIPILAAADEVARLMPFHPYGVLRTRLDQLSEALQFAWSALADLVGELSSHNRYLSTPLGTVKPTASAQVGMDQIDLGALRGPLAVVHFPVLPAFDGPTVAAGLAAARARLGLPDEVVAASCDYFIRRGNALLRPHELSVIVESDVDAFVAAVKRCAPANAAAFLLPPILGRTTPSTVVRALSKSLGVPCGETVAGVPSLPGLRLQEALTAAVGTAAVDVIAGECQAKGLEGPFEILTAAGGVEVPADSVVLATGRFIGGGIRRDLAFAETIFNLPVFSSSERLDRQFIGKLLDRRSASGHEAFRAGLRIDDRLRPLTASGDAASSRLFAAGSVISGYDPAFDKTGLGVAIFTGYLAGLAAAG